MKSIKRSPTVKWIILALVLVAVCMVGDGTMVGYGIMIGDAFTGAVCDG